MSVTARLPVFDGHNDTIKRLRVTDADAEGRSFFTRGDKGHLDLPRARKGGFAGGLFAICLDPKFADPAAVERGVALREAMRLTANLHRLADGSKGRVKVVRDAKELAACLRHGVLAAVLHFEGAEMIDSDLNALEVFYRAGLRSIGICWSRPNLFGTGVRFAHPSSPDMGPGLSDAGFRLVKACNRLGIVVDVAHLNEKGFWDVARTSTAPMVDTHACAHAICPSSRNLTDAQLDAIHDSGGIVGLNFHVAFLREDGKKDADTPLEQMVKHVDYLVDRMGIDHVGFGSDFDGATMPRQLKDASGLPKLLEALRKRGYTDAALNKITHKNWLRVLHATWK